MNQSQLVKSDDDIELAPGFVVSMADVLNAPVSEVNGRGHVLHNVKRTVRVTDVQDADGRPCEVVLTLYAHRSPFTADEAEKLAATKTERIEKREARELKDANTREREIGRACEITESALTRGYEIAAKTGGKTAERVKEALDLAAVLAQSFNPKGLPSAQ